MANALPRNRCAGCLPEPPGHFRLGDGVLSMLLGELVTAHVRPAHQGCCLQQLDTGHGET